MSGRAGAFHETPRTFLQLEGNQDLIPTCGTHFTQIEITASYVNFQVFSVDFLFLKFFVYVKSTLVVPFVEVTVGYPQADVRFLIWILSKLQKTYTKQYV